MSWSFEILLYASHGGLATWLVVFCVSYVSTIRRRCLASDAVHFDGNSEVTAADMLVLQTTSMDVIVLVSGM
jgi:hypothetical protein